MQFLYLEIFSLFKHILKIGTYNFINKLSLEIDASDKLASLKQNLSRYHIIHCIILHIYINIYFKCSPISPKQNGRASFPVFPFGFKYYIFSE